MNKAANPDIQTILCAMDAVNAARNTEELLNDEVNIESRKSVLRDKLKQTYSSQGIAVSDDIIEKGVSEFFEQRYAFKKMPRNINLLIAYLYVSRARIATITSIAFAVILIVAGFWALIYNITTSSQKAAVAKKIATEKAMIEADKKKEATLKSELSSLPAQIKSIGAAIIKLAKEDPVKQKAEFLMGESVAAVAASNIGSLKQIKTELDLLLAQISSEFELTINGSGKTGFWRTLTKNPGEKRYYIVVNAAYNGKSVSIPIKNEEDGKTYNVSQWAEQVSLSEFDAIRNEKASRGVLKEPVFAIKSKGYLNPTYKQGLKVYGSVNAEMYRITKW
jgi:hypothetical protein